MATAITSIETSKVFADSGGPADSGQGNGHGGDLSSLDLMGFAGPEDAYKPVNWPQNEKGSYLGSVVYDFDYVCRVHNENIQYMLRLEAIVANNGHIRSPKSSDELLS